MAADPQLAEEQKHLDRTFAAYDALLGALSVTRRDRQGDVFTEEVLEQMRLERLRAYTSASGPLYFGRIDRQDGEPLYIGRHAVAEADGELLAINWRAPAAEPFYAATTADPRGVARRRRLDIEDRVVLGVVDEQIQTGEEHLTEAIVEDITRQRVGEMRQIISTITPEQYAQLFRFIASEVNAHGYHPVGTASVVRDRTIEAGSPVGIVKVTFVLRGIGYAGHRWHHGHEEPKDLADAFRRNVLRLCERAQMQLTDEERGLIERWLLGGLVPAPTPSVAAEATPPAEAPAEPAPVAPA